MEVLGDHCVTAHSLFWHFHPLSTSLSLGLQCNLVLSSACGSFYSSLCFACIVCLFGWLSMRSHYINHQIQTFSPTQWTIIAVPKSILFACLYFSKWHHVFFLFWIRYLRIYGNPNQPHFDTQKTKYRSFNLLFCLFCFRQGIWTVVNASRVVFYGRIFSDMTVVSPNLKVYTWIEIILEIFGWKHFLNMAVSLKRSVDISQCWFIN